MWHKGAELLTEVAAEDLARTGTPPILALLQGLSAARCANVIRYWLKSTHGTTPETAQMKQLIAQIDACRTRGHQVRLKVGQGFVERRGDRLHWTAADR